MCFDESLVRKTGQKTRIVVVGMVASPHLARWLAAGRDCDAEVLLFPSVPYRSVHPILDDVIRSSGALNVRIHSGGGINPPIHSAFQRFVPRAVRARMLAYTIDEFGADVVHAVELQHAGYLSARALELLNTEQRPILSVVNWGSDIYWFQRRPWHRRQIRKVLSEAQLYYCECQRDVKLARSFGFAGATFSPEPNCGGVEAPTIKQPPLIDRRTIALKGYSSFVGRAHHLLLAWAVLNPKLDGACLEIYSASQLVRLIAVLVKLRNPNLTVISYPHGSLSSDEMWDLLVRSRVYVGFSASDGLSTSLLEAISSGTIPIQTDSACTSDLRDGGFHIVDVSHTRPFAAVRVISEAFLQPDSHQGDVNRNAERARELLRPEAVSLRSESSLDALTSWVNSNRRA